MTCNRQAARLPKQFRVKSKQLDIERRGDELVRREKPVVMRETLEILDSLPNELGLKPRTRQQATEAQGSLMSSRFLLDANILVYLQTKRSPAVEQRFLP